MVGQVNRNATRDDYMKLRNAMLAQKAEQEKARRAEAKAAKASKKIREVKIKERDEIKEKIRQLEQKKADKPIKEKQMTEAHKQYLMRQERKAAREAEREAKRQKEAKMKESFSIEKKIRAGKSGIERYFLYDLNNPIDVEIVRRIEQYDHLSHWSGQQEQNIRRILQKRLRYRTNGQKNTDQVIEMKLLQRCNQRGITRNELVRELFCIHFNIKEGLERVSQTHNPELTQKDFCTLVLAHSSH